MIKCPKCDTELIKTGNDYLETFTEHLLNNSGCVFLKDFYTCQNINCENFNKLKYDKNGNSLLKFTKFVVKND